MPEPIQVFLLDDHTLFREGLLRLLESDERVRVVGSAGTVEEAARKLPGLRVDVLIADYDLGGTTVAPLLESLAAQRSPIKVLLVTAGVPDDGAVELIRLGVAGILPKQRPPEDLLRSILDTAAGKVVMDQEYLRTLVSKAEGTRERLRLTERERTILSALLEGLSNKEIAARLALSESAIKAALQQLFARTGVRTRSQLVRIALEELRDEL